MVAIVNDISFMFMYSTIDEAIKGVHEFLDICKRVKMAEITNIEEIRTGVVDTQQEIAPNYKLIRLVQEFRNREERSFLLSILTNQGTYQSPNGELCEIAGRQSIICSQAVDNFLVSLMSNCIFASNKIEGTITGRKVELRNLAQTDHIEFYRCELGIRRYVANNTKHKLDKDNYYGKGKIGSRMDLPDHEAQDLLNRALYIKGRLYAKKYGQYYAFQHEGDVIYHAYCADDLPDDIKRCLDKSFP